ncbi:MAG: DUF479 domain-containing protein [Flavobacteriales bacterium]|nr:DUF479 domain-containing protein [Flavobacteriales bacterium]
MNIAIGNFIGDGVKGRITEKYPPLITVGLRLHRFIDDMADTHPVNLEARKALYPHFGKYSAVVQDMLHDHFLALHWDNYSEQDISTYLDEFYKHADRSLDIFPEHQKRFYLAMKEGNWLMNYRYLDNIERAFSGLSRRVLRPNSIHLAGQYLRKNHSRLEAEFLIFFPILMRASQIELDRLLTKL